MKARTRYLFAPTVSALALVGGTLTVVTVNAVMLKADFNNDGFEGVVVESRLEDVNGHADAGAVSVFYGAANGFTTEPNRQRHPDSPCMAGVDEHDRPRIQKERSALSPHII